MDTHGYNDQYSFLKQKFDSYEVDLPADDWAVFSKKLAAAQSGRRRFAWFYIAAAASIIGILFVGLSYLVTDNQPTHQPLQASQANADASAAARARQLAAISVAEKAPARNPVGNPGANHRPSQAAVAMKPLLATSNTTATEQAVAAGNEAKTESASPSSREQAMAKTATQVGAATATNTRPVNDFDSTGYITHPVKQYAELPVVSPDKKNEEKSADKKKPSGSHSPVNWLAGTFTGNLGLSSGAEGDVLSDGSLGTHLLTRVAKADALAASSTPSIISFSGNKTYYPPLSFGLMVGIPLRGRWELQSGLEYTLLVTTGNISSSSLAKGTGRIEENYIGIPVALSYAVLHKPSFSVYLIGGGKVEKGVSLVEKTYTYDAQDNLSNQTNYQYSISGLQFSLDAGVGASYRLYRFINWYLEAGGAWYIPGNQPESSRTEHPINVLLKTGIRFSLTK